MLPKWTLNSWSSCLRVQSARVTGVCHHVLLFIFMFRVSDDSKHLLGLMACACSPSTGNADGGGFLKASPSSVTRLTQEKKKRNRLFIKCLNCKAKHKLNSFFKRCMLEVIGILLRKAYVAFWVKRQLTAWQGQLARWWGSQCSHACAHHQ